MRLVRDSKLGRKDKGVVTRLKAFGRQIPQTRPAPLPVRCFRPTLHDVGLPLSDGEFCEIVPLERPNALGAAQAVPEP